MSDGSYHDLKIGESVQVERGLLTRVSFVYAGMPSDAAFSLAVVMSHGHIGTGYNLYFPLDHRQFELAGVPISVQAVSPTAIQLTLDKA